MGICIFCNKENQAKSIEHIVSESFGNKQYIVERGRVCDDCNSRFSKFEGEALSNTVFVMERAIFGIETKKGKTKIKRKENMDCEVVEDATQACSGSSTQWLFSGD